MANEPPGLDYRQAKRGARRKLRPAEILVILMIVGLALSIVIPSWFRANQPSGRLPCPSNLRQIGQGLFIYADGHGGWFPDRLEELVLAGILPPETLVCPDGPERAAKGQDVAQLREAYRQKGRVSYLFAVPGARLTDLAADEVIAYESSSNHNGEGSDVVFADGHVEFVHARDLPGLIAATRAHAATRPTTTRAAGL